MKIVVFFSGAGTNLRSFLEQEDDLNYEVVSAFTNNPKAHGIQIASEFNKPCKIIDHQDFLERETFDQEIYNYLEGIDFDYIVLAGYMRILSSFLVEAYEGQIINIHPSLLPKYPGLDTHKRALAANDTHHGTTIHFDSSVNLITLNCEVAVEREAKTHSLKLKFCLITFKFIRVYRK